MGECEKSLRIPPNKLPVFPVLFYSLKLDGYYLFYENVCIFNYVCIIVLSRKTTVQITVEII